MPSTNFTVRVDKCLDLDEWQVAGVKTAIDSLDRGEGIAHRDVKNWVNSWSRKRERPAPKRPPK
jgi:predicted transcriptional regulator